MVLSKTLFLEIFAFGYSCRTVFLKAAIKSNCDSFVSVREDVVASFYSNERCILLD